MEITRSKHGLANANLIPTVAAAEAARPALLANWSQDETGAYINSATGEHTPSHPLVDAYRKYANHLITARTPHQLLPAVQADSAGWFLLTDADGVPYYFNFNSGQLQYSFPQLSTRTQGVGDSALLRPCSTMSRTVLRCRLALPSYMAASEYIYSLLESGVVAVTQLEAESCALRAQQLWQHPLPLSAVLMLGQYLGIDPIAEPLRMWIADYAYMLPLPLGWTVHELDGTPIDRPRKFDHFYSKKQFYHHRVLAVSQWEPPQWSYCRGMLDGIRRWEAETSSKQQVVHCDCVGCGQSGVGLPPLPPHYLHSTLV